MKNLAPYNCFPQIQIYWFIILRKEKHKIFKFVLIFISGSIPGGSTPHITCIF